MTAVALLDEVTRAGGALALDGDTFKVRAPTPLPGDLVTRLREAKADVIEELRRSAAPRIEADGTLRIPVNASPECRWWAGGRSIPDILQDLDAAPDVFRQHLSPEQLECWEERAAILEHQGGLTREHAEREALRQVVERSP